MDFETNSNLLDLPSDLKYCIFRYLTLPDLVSLYKTSDELKQYLRKETELWCFTVYIELINNRTQEFFCIEDPLERDSEIRIEEINLEAMRGMINEVFIYYQIRTKFEDFFAKIYNQDPKFKPLLAKILDVGKYPCLPEPILKKDTHHFPTKTEFQNYLTEQFFGIHKSKNPYDRRIKMMIEIMGKINASFQSDSDLRIAKLRWYNPPENSNKDSDQDDNSSHSSSFTSKRIKKYSFKKVRQEKKLKRHDSEMSLTHTDSRESRESKDSRETADSDVKAECLDKNDLEVFYDLVKEYIENYCKIRLIYLSSQKKMDSLLNEYTTCWKKYVFVLIELTKVFQPYSEKINKLYKETKYNYVNFSEFSFWRMMVRIWVSEVFQPLSFNLATAFRNLIIKSRINDMRLNQANLQESRKVSDWIEEICPNCLEFSDINSSIEAQDKNHKLLSEFYQVLSDISFNEYSVFFNDCVKITNKTPREDFEILVAEDSIKFYEALQKFYPSTISNQEMNNIHYLNELQWVKKNFDKNIFLKVAEKQIEKCKSIIKESLEIISNDKLKLEERTHVDVKFSEMTIGEKNNENVKVMNTEIHLQRQEILDIAKKYQNLQDLCYYTVKVYDDSQTIINETNETIKSRFQRGFVLADDKFDIFFSSCLNPCLDDILKHSSQKIK